MSLFDFSTYVGPGHQYRPKLLGIKKGTKIKKEGFIQEGYIIFFRKINIKDQ